MTVLSDKWIKNAASKKGMIRPFVSKQVRKGKISFGLSSYGYDARVSNEFKIFTNVNSATVDPKKFSDTSFVDREVVWELYRNAKMLVFPSLLGPNNLPPLEALSVGCPAIVSGLEGHKQQFSDSVLYFDPFDHIDLANQIEELLGNEKLKESLLSNAEKLIKDTSPERYFQRLLPILMEFKLHSSTYTS